MVGVAIKSILLSLCPWLGPLIHLLPAVEKREARELEKCAMKLGKSECSLLFNGACLREKV